MTKQRVYYVYIGPLFGKQHDHFDIRQPADHNMKWFIRPKTEYINGKINNSLRDANFFRVSSGRTAAKFIIIAPHYYCYTTVSSMPRTGQMVRVHYSIVTVAFSSRTGNILWKRLQGEFLDIRFGGRFFCGVLFLYMSRRDKPKGGVNTSNSSRQF